MAELRPYVRLVEQDFMVMSNHLEPHLPLHPGNPHNWVRDEYYS